MQTEDVLQGQCGSGGSVFKRELFGGPAWIRALEHSPEHTWDGYKKSGYCDCCDPPYKLGRDGVARRMVDCTVGELRERIAEICAELDWNDRAILADDRITELKRLLPEEAEDAEDAG